MKIGYSEWAKHHYSHINLYRLLGVITTNTGAYHVDRRNKLESLMRFQVDNRVSILEDFKKSIKRFSGDSDLTNYEWINVMIFDVDVRLLFPYVDKVIRESNVYPVFDTPFPDGINERQFVRENSGEIIDALNKAIEKYKEYKINSIKVSVLHYVYIVSNFIKKKASYALKIVASAGFARILIDLYNIVKELLK